MIELNHKRLIVYQKSADLALFIYKLTLLMPDSERYGLISQLRRAAISIPSNIAEGAARSSKKESARFYDIARSSLVEIDTQIELAVKLNYLSVHEIAETGEIANEVFAMLSKMIKDPF